MYHLYKTFLQAKLCIQGAMKTHDADLITTKMYLALRMSQ